MKHFFALIILLAVFGCQRTEPADVGGIKVPVELLDAAEESNFDLTGNLVKALEKDKDALQQLIHFSEKSDSATAALNGEVLRALLTKTGDGFFSTAIAEGNETEKQAAWEALETDKSKPLKMLAPETWKAVLPKVEPLPFTGLYVPRSDNKACLDCSMPIFRDCAMPDAKYVAVDETGKLDLEYKRTLRYPYPGQAVYAEIKGYKTGFYANMELPDNCEAFFVVTEIGKLEAKNIRNICLPFDYWAMGTEPFWYVEISAKEGVIEYRDADSEKAKFFPYISPVKEDSMSVFAAVNPDSGDNIRLAIEKKPCSDGMSDRKYRFKVTATVNGRELHGCALGFEERAKGEN